MTKGIRIALTTGMILSGSVAFGLGASKIVHNTHNLKADLALAKMQTKDGTLTLKQTGKIFFKWMGPAIGLCIAGAGLIAGSVVITERTIAIAETSAALATASLKNIATEASKKTAETVADVIKEGPSEDSTAVKDISEKKNGREHNEIYVTGNEFRCYDEVTGRYFKSNIQKIESAINKLNRYMLLNDVASVNDYAYELGLSNVPDGDTIGWSMADGYIDMSSPQAWLDDDGAPCIYIRLSRRPKEF